jgi:4-carboxymuconolactone decarboxylase
MLLVKQSRLAGGLALAAVFALTAPLVATPMPASGSLVAGAITPALSGGGFTMRLAAPRMVPIDKAHATPEQAAIIASSPVANIFKTLARDPALFSQWSPIGQFILLGSSIQPRHREMAMLRMGWLCQAPYEWAAHARIAQQRAGMTAAEVHAIAEGSGAKGWSDTDRAVLKMTDELRYDATISDSTWLALHKAYSDKQVMELIITAGQYQIVSMALNTLGVQIDPGNMERLPTDVALPPPALRAAGVRLEMPRNPPRPVSGLSPEEREMVKTGLQPDGSLRNVDATLIVHAKLYSLRSNFDAYIQSGGVLSPRTRELLIMRTAWNQRTAYEWGRHAPLSNAAGLTRREIARIAQGPSAPGWSPQDKAVLQAADDLRREAFVSEATWTALSKRFDDQSLIEIIFTVGWSEMRALDINSLGIQAELGAAPMPAP